MRMILGICMIALAILAVIMSWYLWIPFAVVCIIEFGLWRALRAHDEPLLTKKQDLRRFMTAQDQRSFGTLNTYYEQAHQELTNGHKETCWIWFIFPQVIDPANASCSEKSRQYALRDYQEICNYLMHETLFSRYRTLIDLVHQKLVTQHVDPLRLMGKQVDVDKLASSVTLFSGVIGHLLKTQSFENSKKTDFEALKTTCDAILTKISCTERYTARFLMSLPLPLDAPPPSPPHHETLDFRSIKQSNLSPQPKPSSHHSIL